MTPELRRFSEQSIAQGSQSFARAARLFASAVREDAILLYAWCRHCDDVIDGQTLGHHTAAPVQDMAGRLASLRQQTEAALQGEANHPAFAALAHVAQRHQLPARQPLDLIDGFAMDAEGRRYQTLEELLLYCYRVAGVVGRMMGRIMGVRDEATLHRATDLGLAFQLTNIARDVVADAEAGRLYLPLDWLEEAGLPQDPAALLHPRHRAGLHQLALRLLAAAEPYSASARIGLSRLPRRSAWAIATALAVYRDIGVKLARGGPQAWEGRVHTGRLAKLWRVAQSGLATLALRAQAETPRHGLWMREMA